MPIAKPAKSRILGRARRVPVKVLSHKTVREIVMAFEGASDSNNIAKILHSRSTERAYLKGTSMLNDNTTNDTVVTDDSLVGKWML